VTGTSHHFGWQEGDGAFSIGISGVEGTMNYIRHQAEHHRKLTFKEELEVFLKKSMAWSRCRETWSEASVVSDETQQRWEERGVRSPPLQLKWWANFLVLTGLVRETCFPRALPNLYLHPMFGSRCYFRRIGVLLTWISTLPCLLAAPAPLVEPGDEWLFHKGTNAVQNGWKTLADSALEPATWARGQGGFGYASDNAAETGQCKTLLTDMEDNYKTLFYRRTFTVSAQSQPETNLHLMLTMDFDDGFIAWLDGQYLTNQFSPGAPAEPAHDASATTSHESSLGNSSPQAPVTFDLGPVGSRLAEGEHILAIVGLNNSSGSSDFIQVARLFLDVPTPVPTNSLSGALGADTTLYASNSPYLVSADLTVPSGVTLTIEPGATVFFGTDADLIIANGGRLVAEGTAGLPIRFTRPATSSPAWGHIVINGGVGSPETRIAHAYIEGNGSAPCIAVNAGTVYLGHIIFGTTNRRYLDLDDSSFVVTDCHFPPPTASFEPVHGTGGIKPGGRGIIQNCFFGAHTGYNDTIDFSGGNRPGPILQVINNVFMGTGDDNLDLDSNDAWVQGNLFLHIHKNGTPDTSSGVSGGNDDGRNGDVTIIGNIFYDCDQAAMAKQGNYYVLLNNTIVRQTHIGGLDTEGAVICTQDNNMTEGRGMLLEGNVIVEAEKLARDVVNAVVTFQNNLLPLPWPGPGSGNSTNDPMLAYIPRLDETQFTNWAQAQVLREWFRPRPGSPALGAGPHGLDLGGVVPFGVALRGAPTGTVTTTSVTVHVGVNRSGGAIPESDWPAGAGYTHYRWRLDTNAWSAEKIISEPIMLTNLADGPHTLEVIGKNDAGMYQNDPDLGSNARVTTAHWTVQAVPPAPRITAIETAGTNVLLRFTAAAGQGYAVEFVGDLQGDAMWRTLTNVAPQTVEWECAVADSLTEGTRFYRLVRSVSSKQGAVGRAHQEQTSPPVEEKD